MNYSLIAIIVIVVILSAYFMRGHISGGSVVEGLTASVPAASSEESAGCVNGVCSVPKKKKVKTD